MSAAVKQQFSSWSEPAEKRDREGSRDLLRSILLRCEQCGQAWLVVGAKVNDRHKCKSCSHSFLIEPRVTAEP
jgi:DNA-directed RNA polymerase subunit RPC12/RpoP